MMLLLPPANGKRTANLGPIEDFAFLATVATMWTLWARGNLALISIPLVLLPAALCCFVLMGVELGVRQSAIHVAVKLGLLTVDILGAQQDL